MELDSSTNEEYFSFSQSFQIFISLLSGAEILPAYTPKVEMTAKFKTAFNRWLFGTTGQQDINPSVELGLYGTHDL